MHLLHLGGHIHLTLVLNLIFVVEFFLLLFFLKNQLSISGAKAIFYVLCKALKLSSC